ncbi:hypothetical protein GCM10007987_17930 [Aliivibrio fischeri]|nr:hypothetical protein GCM10007987_17930 [Aliivibrio fischeri]
MKNIDEISKLLIEQRKGLGVDQKDMYMRIGMKQQQYQRIEAGSDVKLSTLLRVLEGLDLELSITPKSSKALSNQTSESLNKSDLQDDADDLEFWFGSELIHE